MSEEALGIPPQPVPMNIGIQAVKLTDGMGNIKDYVMIVDSSPTGQHFIFLEPEAVPQVLNQLKEAMRTASTGLVIAKSLGNGHKGP